MSEGDGVSEGDGMGKGDGVGEGDGMGEDEGEQCMCEGDGLCYDNNYVVVITTQAISHKPSSPSPFLLERARARRACERAVCVMMTTMLLSSQHKPSPESPPCPHQQK